MTNTVWIYVNTSKQVGDEEHLKVCVAVEYAAPVNLFRVH